MNRTRFVAALVVLGCGLLPCLDAQPPKKPLLRGPSEKVLAKRKEKEKQEAREAYDQAKQVRGVVDRLSRLLTAVDEEARYQAALGLAEIGPSAVRAVSPLASRLFDESPRVRVAVVEALSSIGPAAKEAVPDLVIVLKDSDPLVRERAAGALGVLHSYPEIAVPALIKALDDPAKVGVLSVRLTAIMALGKFGPEAKAAYPRLMKEFKEGKDPSIQGFILHSMATTRANTPELLRLLIDIINDPTQENLHSAAASAVGNIGPEAKIAIPHLLKLFECKNLKQPKLGISIRLSVLRAFAGLGNAAKEAVPAIIRYAADPILAHTAARHDALVVLGDLGPTAKEAIPFLIDCLQQREFGQYRWLLGRALRRIGKEAIKPLIGAYLTAPDGSRSGLIYALGVTGAEEALPLLEAEANNRKSRYWSSALWSIQAIKSRRPR